MFLNKNPVVSQDEPTVEARKKPTLNSRGPNILYRNLTAWNSTPSPKPEGLNPKP